MPKLTYSLLGKTLIVYEVEVGEPLPLPEVPPMEDHEFVGWRELPEKMGEADLLIEAECTPRKYTLSVEIDGVVTATFQYAAGESLEDLPSPRKAGYTFSGWRKNYSVMPKMNLTLRGKFRPNVHTLTFEFDGISFSRRVAYGTPITAMPVPTKENHTFSGWGKIPETMPDRDLRLHGTFDVSSYTVTYLLEGEVYRTDALCVGDRIKPPVMEKRENYTFSGWRGLPKVMPNSDLTVKGRYYAKKSRVPSVADGKGEEG